MRVLIVEDDPIIIEGLRIALSQEGYEVEHAETMKAALQKIDSLQVDSFYDICLLDVMLPDGDGYQICRAIREKSQVPVLFLTACDDEIHTVLALEQGADDYIAKPFRIRELLARMKAILRRTGRVNGGVEEGSGEKKQSDEKEQPGGSNGNVNAADHRNAGGAMASRSVALEIARVGENEVNVMSGKVYRGGEEVFLSAVEYRLLLTFLRSRGQLLTRQQILNDMWDQAGDFVNDNTLTVYVKRLRKKLEEDGSQPLIETVRGIGYRMM